MGFSNNKEMRGWPLLEKFLHKTYPEPNSGCWLWSGYANQNGYGIMYSYGVAVLAHRFSFEHFNNTKLLNGEIVCHKCNIPFCVNPDHLYAGSQFDNMRQCFRQNRGGHSFNPQRKVVQVDLTTGKPLNIFWSIMEAQRKTGVSQPCISKACKLNGGSALGYKWFYLENFATLPDKSADEMREEERESIINLEKSFV